MARYKNILEGPSGCLEAAASLPTQRPSTVIQGADGGSEVHLQSSAREPAGRRGKRGTLEPREPGPIAGPIEDPFLDRSAIKYNEFERVVTSLPRSLDGLAVLMIFLGARFVPIAGRSTRISPGEGKIVIKSSPGEMNQK